MNFVAFKIVIQYPSSVQNCLKLVFDTALGGNPKLKLGLSQLSDELVQDECKSISKNVKKKGDSSWRKSLKENMFPRHLHMLM